MARFEFRFGRVVLSGGAGMVDGRVRSADSSADAWPAWRPRRLRRRSSLASSRQHLTFLPDAAPERSKAGRAIAHALIERARSGGENPRGMLIDESTAWHPRRTRRGGISPQPASSRARWGSARHSVGGRQSRVDRRAISEEAVNAGQRETFIVYHGAKSSTAGGTCGRGNRRGVAIRSLRVTINL